MTKIVRALVLALAVAMVLPIVSLAAWPVASSRSYVSQRYSDGHRGLDIAAPYGTQVFPITTGKVIFAGWKNNCGGYQVWLSHANNLYTAYYHLSTETTSVGAAVSGSYTRIGRVGRTGCASGNHVHVETWRGYPWRTGSYRVNPWNYVMNGPHLPGQYR
jgi:murein DD-endopeptidase MepM/ murein hydrolase activator NlpD